ncbi:YihY/virulence factor BrkB family protein [Nostoc sp. NIES-2111]
MPSLRPADYWAITKKTMADFSDDNPMNYAAILSYYTVFSLPAVLILILRLAGLALGEEAVSGELFRQIGGIVGPTAAKDVQEIVRAATTPADSVIATIIGIGTLAFSATTVFVSLQEAINNIWGVKAKPEKGWLKYLINRLLSVAIVGAFAFLLLVSLSVDALVQVLTGYISRYFSEAATVLTYITNQFFAIASTTLLFALVFKVLPDARVRWRNVWTGAVVTALLFTLGKFLIGLYIGWSNTQSAYGAAGSVVLVMVWVYYSSVILLLGAEFTKVFSLYTGEAITPAEHAVKIEVRETHTDQNGHVEDVKLDTPEKEHNTMDDPA